MTTPTASDLKVAERILNLSDSFDVRTKTGKFRCNDITKIATILAEHRKQEQEVLRYILGVLQSMQRLDGHNGGCSYDYAGIWPETDYCNCDHTIRTAITRLNELLK